MALLSIGVKAEQWGRAWVGGGVELWQSFLLELWFRFFTVNHRCSVLPDRVWIGLDWSVVFKSKLQVDMIVCNHELLIGRF